VFLCIIRFPQLSIYTSKACSSRFLSFTLFFDCPSLGCIKEIFIRKKRVEGGAGWRGGTPSYLLWPSALVKG